MNPEIIALRKERRKLYYRLLNLHIAFSRLIYSSYHDNTRYLIRKRNLIDAEVQMRVRDAMRIKDVTDGKYESLSGEELNKEANKLLDEVLHKEKEIINDK